jgi:hypothetical protein
MLYHRQPENAVITLSLEDIREVARQYTGVIDILGKLYKELGLSGIITRKAGKILKFVVLWNLVASKKQVLF